MSGRTRSPQPTGEQTSNRVVASGDSTAARLLVLRVAGITTVGALLADVIGESAAQHIFNDGRPPHAKFHDAQYIVMSILLGLLAMGLIVRRVFGTATLRLGASLVALPWLGMFGALLFPGTAAHDPEFIAQPVVAGLHAQFVIALAMLALLAVAVAVDGIARHRVS